MHRIHRQQLTEHRRAHSNNAYTPRHASVQSHSTFLQASSMATKLNPTAAEFVPSSFTDSMVSWGGEEFSEDHITPEELAELEAAEEWVELQSALEEQEESHLIAVALRFAPEAKVAEIQKRCGLRPTKLRLHKGIRTRAAKGC